MIIAVTAHGVELQAPDDFKSFKIVAAGDLSSGALQMALNGIATVDTDGKTAWVGRDAVKRLRGPSPAPDWAASFDRMVESVRRFGWVKDETVRAHIETAPS
ncbi:MAG TPA: hypothetical protein VGB82_14235 [Alphaproteobacteria bacterium]